jgi:hypothetical protein
MFSQRLGLVKKTDLVQDVRSLFTGRISIGFAKIRMNGTLME